MEEPTEAAATWERVDSLVPWDRNPRRHDKSLPHTIESMRQFGFGSPLVCRPSDRRVMVGNGRLRAAEALGMEIVPVRWLELDDRAAVAFALADNAIPKLSTDNRDELDALLEEVGQPIPGIETKEDSEVLSIDETFDAPVRDEFWLVIRGLIELQPEALTMADELGTVCDVHAGTIRK